MRGPAPDLPPSGTLGRKSKSQQPELRQRPPRGSLYLWDFPPPAIVRVSRKAGGVVGAAGRGGGADPVRRGDAGVLGLAHIQEPEATAL